MAFCLQLRLLMWKNLLYRRRQKLRLCVELIWPLFMFVVLAWIRSSGLKIKLDNCYYTEKAMPSAGVIPYVHGFFCNFNNTCEHNENDSHVRLGKLFQEGGADLLFQRLNEVVNNHTSSQSLSLSDHIENVSDNLTQILNILNSESNQTENFQRAELQMSLENVVFGYKNIRKHIEMFSEEINKEGDEDDQLLWMREILGILKEFICNDTFDYDAVLADDLDDESFDSFGDDLLQFAINRQAGQFSPPTKECLNIMQNIESHKKLNLVWRILKPLFVGKIIFTPVTKVTQNIMNRVNDNFKIIKLLQPLADIVPNMNKTMNRTQRSITSQNIKQIHDLMNSKNVTDQHKHTIKKLIKIFKKLENGGAYFRMKSFSDDKGKSIDVRPKDLLNCLEANKTEGYHDYKEAENVAFELGLRNRLYGLVHFTKVGEDKILPFVNYTIRMNTDRVDNTHYIKDKVKKWYPRMRPSETKYVTNGFIYLQDMVEHSIMQELTGRDDIPGTVIQFFPYPCHTYDSFITAISATFPFFMVMSWIYTCSMIVKSIVHEKEKRLKETMRVMGLGNGIHWLGWFIDSFVPMVLTVIILTLILTFGRVIELSEPTLVFVFLTVYTLACISFSFFLSIFFSRANIAAAVSGLIFFFLYLPYPFLVRWMERLNFYHKFFASISMNVALGLGASYLALFEEAGTGLHWNTINTSPRYGDNYSMLYVMITLILDFFLFLILTWYLEAVMPGQYGIPKPWYFPFVCDYWRGNLYRHTTASKPLQDPNVQDPNFFEEEPDLEPGVVIDNLSKVYKNGKVAVSRMSINFFEGQITSLLGHNGAGKTTTISMLTGIYRPSSGDAFVNGYSIKKEMDKVRTNLGMCPQFNVLFDRLTVEEHLIFYGKLRGGNQENLESEINQMLQDLQLERKRGAFPGDLSGGMQRKLSIAVAYIGGAKTVILDEPTSGVDPYSRRSIWELLIKYKKDRTIILTTHYMDEADLLSDRVAIIANGRIQCAGSVTFLKEKLGKGYEITVELNPVKQNQEDETLPIEISHIDKKDIDAVTDAIRTIIPGAVLEDHKGSEIKYTIPERNSAQIASLCDYLDAREEQLNIVSYGITDCSLEDIFLTVTGEADTRKSTRISITGMPSKIFHTLTKALHRQRGSVTSKGTQETIENQKHKKITKNFRQFKALMAKRFHHSKRNRKEMFAEWVSPCLIILFAMFVTKLFPTIEDRPPFPLVFDPYDEPRYLFHASGQAGNNTESMIKELKSERGYGPNCVKNEQKERDEECVQPEVTKDKFSPSEACSCETGMQDCSETIDDPLPGHIKTATKDTSIDLTNQRIAEWIINTYPKYKESRLAGVELSASSQVPNLNVEELIFKLYTQHGIPKLDNNKKDVPKDDKNETNVPKDFNMTDVPEDDKNTTRRKRESGGKGGAPHKKIWVNNKAWHSSVTMLNYVNNGILRSLHGGNKEVGIMAINHPLNFTQKEYELEVSNLSSRNIITTIAVIFAMSFIPASFTLFLIDERKSNAKHLQLSSGVSRIVYWTQTFIWDIVCFIISALLCILLFVIFDYQEFISSDHFPGILTLFIFYGWAIIPLMYAGSFMFDVPASAFVTLACLNVFIGVVTTIVPSILTSFKDNKDIQNVNKLLTKLFLIFPQFCLGDGLTKLSSMHKKAAILGFFDYKVKSHVFHYDGILLNIIMLIILGILYFIVTLCLEFEVLSRLRQRNKPPATTNEDLEEDVAAERERVRDPECKDIMIVQDLYKKYRRKPQPSVRGINLGVKAGECFGLLGINGAGKTTTFKMLTGELKPSSGDAKIRGFSINKDIDKARSLMGYCPQFDALHPLLTVRETLKLYADIRNIPSSIVLDEMIKELGLMNFSDKLAGDLSGGNKRKLSTAIALMGRPPVIFLDEPTTGMDPKSRRFLWSCIEEINRNGTCVILTSHSMEECQALCTKLTVMVNGQFRCLGSVQHLKKKYGKGYQFIIRFSLDKKEEAKEFVTKTFPTSTVDEEHLNQIRYHVMNIKVSVLFSKLEEGKSDNKIIDFSVSQTTLEEVFMTFAKEQELEEEIKMKESIFSKLFSCFRKKSVQKEEIEPEKTVPEEVKEAEETKETETSPAKLEDIISAETEESASTSKSPRESKL